MKVFIPTPLRSYTGKAGVIEAEGPSVSDVLTDIDRRHPGFRFRIIDEQDGIREHIKIFVNEEQTRDLRVPVTPSDVLHIICGLSGGKMGT